VVGRWERAAAVTAPPDSIVIDFNDNEPEFEFNDNRPVEDILAEFDAGALSEEDFDGVLVFPEEIAPLEPDYPEVEELMTVQEAHQFLDSLNPQWRAWRAPPAIPLQGRGWSGLFFSRAELRGWVERHTSHAETAFD
jgi:hypothetical protein